MDSKFRRAADTPLLGQSEVFLEFLEDLSRFAVVDRPVILAGERGTGKELAAARLHFLSPRWQGPFGTLNCSSLSGSLLESELFGHEAGAFTGAAARRKGWFEACDGGTLFLDEIASMPGAVQEKILRVAEYGVFTRVGGTASVTGDTRIIAATNADLPELARRGKFRLDLLDRLSFTVLTLPPLRERGEDVMLLAGHFASRMAVELARPDTPEFTPEAVLALREHSWPGNVRELKNAVERAVAVSTGPLIEAIEFDPFASPFRDGLMRPQRRWEPPENIPDAPARQNAEQSASLADEVRELEMRRLKQALERATWNQRRAAELLGLSYHQFRGLWRKYAKQFNPPEKT
jgi:psp operon transcriptional activator